MRKATRILMVILSYMPIATVAVAAQAKASEMDGEAQTFKMRTMLQAARFRWCHLVRPARHLTMQSRAMRT